MDCDNENFSQPANFQGELMKKICTNKSIHLGGETHQLQRKQDPSKWREWMSWCLLGPAEMQVSLPACCPVLQPFCGRQSPAVDHGGVGWPLFHSCIFISHTEHPFLILCSSSQKTWFWLTQDTVRALTSTSLRHSFIHSCSFEAHMKIRWD